MIPGTSLKIMAQTSELGTTRLFCCYVMQTVLFSVEQLEMVVHEAALW
jgi:hypothetical protein